MARVGASSALQARGPCSFCPIALSETLTYRQSAMGKSKSKHQCTHQPVGENTSHNHCTPWCRRPLYGSLLSIPLPCIREAHSALEDKAATTLHCTPLKGYALGLPQAFTGTF